MTNISCDQFKYLLQIYKLTYICSNYDINCDSYCETNEDCDCYCMNDNIYCAKNTYFYAWRILSTLLVILLFVCCCYGCIKFVSSKKKNGIDYQYIQPPSYNFTNTNTNSNNYNNNSYDLQKPNNK
jgi:hypothetical protein